MQCVNLFFVCAIIFVIVKAKPATKELYTDEFDNIDIYQVLNNKRLFNNYVACLKNKRPCPGNAQKLKELLPEALKSGCEKCTDTQKKKTTEVANYILEKRPDIFLELEKIYDPKREYRVKYADRIKNAGINLPK